METEKSPLKKCEISERNFRRSQQHNSQITGKKSEIFGLEYEKYFNHPTPMVRARYKYAGPEFYNGPRIQKKIPTKLHGRSKFFFFFLFNCEIVLLYPVKVSPKMSGNGKLMIEPRSAKVFIFQ